MTQNYDSGIKLNLMKSSMIDSSVHLFSAQMLLLFCGFLFLFYQGPEDGLKPIIWQIYRNVKFTPIVIFDLNTVFEIIARLQSDQTLTFSPATDFGISIPIGHVDFFLNGGQDQTGCARSRFASSKFVILENQRANNGLHWAASWNKLNDPWQGCIGLKLK